MKSDEQKIVAEKKLHDMMQKVMAAREGDRTEEEKHLSFEVAKAKYDAMGEIVCSLGIITPRDVELISQYEAKKWMEWQKGKETKNVAIAENISTDGLRIALERYDENFEQGECGDWKIQSDAKEPYSLPFNFNILYDGILFASVKRSSERTPGGSFYLDLNRENAGVSDKAFSQIVAIIKSVYMFARPSLEEQKKLDVNQKGASR